MLFDSALISSGYEMEGSAEDFAQRMQRVLRSGMYCQPVVWLWQRGAQGIWHTGSMKCLVLCVWCLLCVASPQVCYVRYVVMVLACVVVFRTSGGQEFRMLYVVYHVYIVLRIGLTGMPRVLDTIAVFYVCGPWLCSLRYMFSVSNCRWVSACCVVSGVEFHMMRHLPAVSPF